MTFPAPEVEKALEKFELCEVDIDAASNRELCARLHRGGATPTFVVLGEDGAELSRWEGAFEADDFIARLGNATDATAARLLAAGDDHGERAGIFAERGELESTLRELGALTVGGATTAAIEERVSWLLCMTLRDQQRWPELDRAARHYLDRCAGGEHADDARLALGLATFAQTGTTTPELQAHIDRLVTILGEPFPKPSLSDRVFRFFGAQSESSEHAQEQAADDWVERINSTMHELARLGRPALPALHRALRDGDQNTADHAGVVIGWIRDPESRAFLLDLLDHAKLDPARRMAVVNSLGMYKDPADLQRMLALARSDAPPYVRAAAFDAIRSLCVQSDGTTDRAIADALSAALESHDFTLRMAALAAMFEVQAPLALDRLLESMDDKRVMFKDCRICDYALWIFEDQIDQYAVDGTGTTLEHCTPAVASFLNHWYSDARTHLRWDPNQKHWHDDRASRQSQ